MNNYEIIVYWSIKDNTFINEGKIIKCILNLYCVYDLYLIKGGIE